MFWRWCLKLLLDNFINSHRLQDQHHAYQWFIVYVFIFVDTSFIHRLAAPLKETNMVRDSICSSECQKKCSISDRQSADIPPDSSNSAVESVRKFVKSALQMKWQSFNMPFGLSLILHLANSSKKGKVPIVKHMLPVMVRSVYATKYSVEHLRHFKHKTIAKFLLETIPLKNRRSIRILRAHAWKKKLHFEPSKYSMELKAVLLGGNSTTTGVFYETTWPMANSQWKERYIIPRKCTLPGMETSGGGWPMGGHLQETHRETQWWLVRPAMGLKNDLPRFKNSGYTVAIHRNYRQLRCFFQ